MKALSIKQPWAWCIINAYKGVENRSWNTKHRGEFYIHAGKSFDMEGYRWIKRTFPNIPLPKIEEFERGGIVGKAKIINTVHISESRLLTSDDKPWFVGDYGFILDSPKKLKFTPLKGRLGFFQAEELTKEG